MSKRIIFKNQNGVAIVIPSPSALKNNRTLDDIAIKAIKEAGLPVGTEYEIIETSSIPSNRTFRDAWEMEGENIKVSMPKARLIHLDKIALCCQRELDATDKEFILAMELETPLENLKARRMYLRNLINSSNLSIIKTPEELEAFWPTNLISS